MPKNKVWLRRDNEGRLEVLLAEKSPKDAQQSMLLEESDDSDLFGVEVDDGYAMRLKLVPDYEDARFAAFIGGGFGNVNIVSLAPDGKQRMLATLPLDSWHEIASKDLRLEDDSYIVFFYAEEGKTVRAK